MKNNNKFIKAVPSKVKSWITDVYYGIKGTQKHGHFLASGNLVIDNAVLAEGTIINLHCEQPLYHRNAEGKILLDTKIKR